MQRLWSAEELGERWTLGAEDLAVLVGLPAAGKVGFAAQLAYWRQNGRFPDDEAGLAPAVAGHLAAQIGADADALESYKWSGRTGRRHRRLILDHLAVGDFGDDAKVRFRRWLSDDLLPRELGREAIGRDEVRRRLLLCLYGLGTNAGLKRLAVGGHGFSYKELLHTRRRYIDAEALRDANRRVVNATLAVLHPRVWGEGTTACASDSKHFCAFDQNLMTEWHARYGGRGVMIYWRVERGSVCIHSRLRRCSSSKVAGMIEGVLRHDTEMEIERQYVDSHGQSEAAFAFCRLLGFQLLPRLKGHHGAAALPAGGRERGLPQSGLHSDAADRLGSGRATMRRDGELHDRLGRAHGRSRDDPAALHARQRAAPDLQRAGGTGKGAKTIFLCRYLGDAALRREIHEGPNIVETWNSANGFIFFGKGGEVASNRLDHQEVSVHALHLLQSCLVYVNTLMLQRVLAEPAWMARMTSADARGLTPLVWSDVSPCGAFDLDMEQRLDLDVRAEA